jgi:16S rRNA processing protein RimM
MAAKEQQYVNIGHTRKAHGLIGEIKCSIEDQYLEDFMKTERIFIGVRQTKIPYFIANVRGKGEMIVQLEEVSNRDAAQALQSKEIFLREQDIIPDAQREFDIPEEEVLTYSYLAGFVIHDQHMGDIGTIDEVLEMPQQEMAFLKFKGKDVLIPLNDQLIVSINETTKVVLMDLPDGLLEV